MNCNLTILMDKSSAWMMLILSDNVSTLLIPFHKELSSESICGKFVHNDYNSLSTGYFFLLY